MFKNATAAPSKRSRIERNVDKVILFMFALLFSFVITGCVFFAEWTRRKGLDNWYLQLSNPLNDQYNPNTPAFVGFASFITSFILYGRFALEQHAPPGLSHICLAHPYSISTGVNAVLLLVWA